MTSSPWNVIIERYISGALTMAKNGVRWKSIALKDERNQLQSDLQAMPEVRSVTYESKAQAYERVKRLFANQPDMSAP